MSSEILRTQAQFEGILSSNNPAVWNSLSKAQIKGFVFTATHVALLETALLDDSRDFYYKGLLSLYDGIISVNLKNFSWATVKLYYAVYYFLRCSLCCHEIGFARKGRDGYTFRNILGRSPEKASGPDHVVAIELFIQFFQGTDFLQSNTLHGNNAYSWFQDQRVNVNYKFRTFFEPDIPLIWDSISQDCDNDSLKFWLSKYIADDIYAFIDDHAMLALPIRKLILTHADLVAKGFLSVVSPVKESKLNTMMAKNKYLTVFKPFNKPTIP